MYSPIRERNSKIMKSSVDSVTTLLLFLFSLSSSLTQADEDYYSRSNTHNVFAASSELVQYTPDAADWTTLNSKPLGSNTDHTPDGIHWIDREQWLPWDGTIYNPTELTKSELASEICTGNTIRGLREVFYEHNPFANITHPTKAEVDEWHRIAINHVRAMVGYTEEEYQIQPDKCLHLRALWSEERKSSTKWDEKYPTGTCGESSNPHCGAGFVPSKEDQQPYLPQGLDECPKVGGGSEGLFNAAKSNIPWSIRWVRPFCYTLSAEGFWGGHTGPWFHRPKFGFYWRDTNPDNMNSNANLRAKWSGPSGTNKYTNPNLDDNLLFVEGEDPNPRYPGFECKGRDWSVLKGVDIPNATVCYEEIMNRPECGKRFMTWNANGGGGCACYPPTTMTCDEPAKIAGRSTWDFDPKGSSFDGLIVDPDSPLFEGRECKNIDWKGTAGDPSQCLQKLMEGSFDESTENCGRKFMTWNSANGGCGCYPSSVTTCEPVGSSGRITYELTEDPAYDTSGAFDPTAAPVDPTDAPVVPPTDAPVVPPTDAPVIPPTDAPVVPPADTPVVPPTDAPVVPPTDAPVVPPTDAPVIPPTDAPVVPPADAPVVPPTDAPVIPPTDAPVVPPAAPVDSTAPVDPTAAPVDPAAPGDPTAAPVDPTAAPVDPTAAPSSEDDDESSSSDSSESSDNSSDGSSDDSGDGDDSSESSDDSRDDSSDGSSDGSSEDDESSSDELPTSDDPSESNDDSSDDSSKKKNAKKIKSLKKGKSTKKGKYTKNGKKKSSKSLTQQNTIVT